MNLSDYGRILVRRGWIIILLALLTAGSAYVLSRFIPPVYRATQVVLVQPSRTDLGLAEATVRTLNSYRVYLDSRERAQDIINTLQLDMTREDLKSAVTLAVDQLTLTIRIDVDLPDPDMAYNVARAWGQLLVDYRFRENQEARREDRVDALMPDLPVVGLLRPLPSVNTAIGAVLGALIGGIIVFVLEFLESSIVRRREDIERGLDIPVLSAVSEG